MTSNQRVLSYATQNGHWRLTPKQRRRMDHKENAAWRQLGVALVRGGEPGRGKQPVPIAAQ